MSTTRDTTISPSSTTTPERHFTKMIVIWLILSAIADPIFYFVVGPHMPPGAMSSSAEGDAFDFTVLLIIAIPVMIAVWTYLAYAVVTWRARPETPEPVYGPYSRGHLGTQVVWITFTTVVVMGLFVFGTVQLYRGAGSGGGEGPAPVFNPNASSSILQVQVIAQQWRFTYRYPSFGGFETPNLVLPMNTTVEFHVTSLDVIHDFWAYQLGVKADANPSQDNIAYTMTQQLGFFEVRCDELCGIWHGAMYDQGQVMSKAGFMKWATNTETQLAGLTKTLPPYALTYVPDANGADGSLYPDNVDPYSNVETYGAKQGPS